jgi:hypothetical protein
VTGASPILARWLEPELAIRLEVPDDRPERVRVIRIDGARALVEVSHRIAGAARLSWNTSFPLADGRRVTVATHRTYGTLRKGKEWLRARKPLAVAGVGEPLPSRRPDTGV